MNIQRFNFIGFLSNVDPSILKVNFGDSVHPEFLSQDEAYKLLSKLDNYHDYGIFARSTSGVRGTEGDFYVLTHGSHNDLSLDNIFKFEEEIVRPLSEEILPKLRLFKEGNPQMPLWYYFSQNEGQLTKKMEVGPGRVAYGPVFHLDESELPELETFISDTKLPFTKDCINLAFQSYDMSYGSMHSNLAFLLLMIGVESLLNPSKGEITYRVSRYAAVLLGHSASKGETIFREVKDLYRTRSNIVHGTSNVTVQNAELAKLRGILRDLIKEVNRIDKPKDELLRMLDSLGFGERPWRGNC